MLANTDIDLRVCGQGDFEHGFSARRAEALGLEVSFVAPRSTLEACAAALLVARRREVLGVLQERSAAT